MLYRHRLFYKYFKLIWFIFLVFYNFSSSKSLITYSNFSFFNSFLFVCFTRLISVFTNFVHSIYNNSSFSIYVYSMSFYLDPVQDNTFQNFIFISANIRNISLIYRFANWKNLLRNDFSFVMYFFGLRWQHPIKTKWRLFMAW